MQFKKSRQDRRVWIAIRTGFGTVSIYTSRFSDVVGYVWRIPRNHSGWCSVTYKGKRYQLFGGVYVDFFICLNRPIQGRAAKKGTNLGR